MLLMYIRRLRSQPWEISDCNCKVSPVCFLIRSLMMVYWELKREHLSGFHTTKIYIYAYIHIFVFHFIISRFTLDRKTGHIKQEQHKTQFIQDKIHQCKLKLLPKETFVLDGYATWFYHFLFSNTAGRITLLLYYIAVLFTLYPERGTFPVSTCASGTHLRLGEVQRGRELGPLCDAQILLLPELLLQRQQLLSGERCPGLPVRFVFP
jgi:hypothetical protein